MITFVQGNLFDSPAQVLCNTVNCVGIMGKGIALDFKQRYPQMFADYKARCSTYSVKPGNPYIWDDERVQILNFPTKRHWRDNSLIQDIELGLAYLAEHYTELGIHSIAMPPLGCGNGGLDWSVVKPLITRYLAHIPDLEVFIYEPQITQYLPNQLDEKQDSPTKNQHSDRESANSYTGA